MTQIDVKKILHWSAFIIVAVWAACMVGLLAALIYAIPAYFAFVTLFVLLGFSLAKIGSDGMPWKK